MIGDAVITSDPETRRLIVITDEETHEHISQVISNLDRPKPQVLIKVVFAEVTYNNALDLGVEGSFVHNTGSFMGMVTNINVLSNGTQVPVIGQQSMNSVVGGNTSFGLANSLGVPGGAFAQLTGQDYMVTLKAAAQKGKVEILSRPSILARNNQKASIVVGQEVPLITGVNYDSFGNQRNAITYQNVGIILDVTPFITPDGMVEMILKPQISSVDPNSTVQISGATTNSGAVNAPVIDIRAADTVVVTPDGNTVVIGGLMQNNRANTVTKVPLLGDIPILGALFRHKVTSDTKTELLIFLTPYVVQTPHQLALMSTSETTRMQLQPNAFTEKELNQFLDNVQYRKKDEVKVARPPRSVDSGSPKNQN
ncbi:MAG: Type secretion system protein [Verrucomicrobiales bacterium]|nr:Type secretion system protein [Verrucomicrobiales bacterium]